MWSITKNCQKQIQYKQHEQTHNIQRINNQHYKGSKNTRMQEMNKFPYLLILITYKQITSLKPKKKKKKRVISQSFNKKHMLTLLIIGIRNSKHKMIIFTQKPLKFANCKTVSRISREIDFSNTLSYYENTSLLFQFFFF